MSGAKAKAKALAPSALSDERGLLKNLYEKQNV